MQIAGVTQPSHILRLAEIEAELDRLRAQRDQAMSAFRFDEAGDVQRRITALEGERRDVAAALPAAPLAPSPAIGLVPRLMRPRRPAQPRPGRRR